MKRRKRRKLVKRPRNKVIKRRSINMRENTWRRSHNNIVRENKNSTTKRIIAKAIGIKEGSIINTRKGGIMRKMRVNQKQESKGKKLH